MSSYLEEALAQLKIFEGVVQWMYLDSTGKVTVGSGLMLPNIEAATSLPFQYDNRPAVAQEITVDFRRVSMTAHGKAVGFYRSAMSVVLTLPEIDKLLRQKVAGFELQLRTAISTYHALPSSAKLALIDMAYNLGPHGLFKGYPRMLKAIAAGDWATAAAESHRDGPNAVRNEWTKNQLLAAATVPLITASIDARAAAKSEETLPLKAAATPKKAVKKTAAKTVKKVAKKAVSKPAQKAAKKKS